VTAGAEEAEGHRALQAGAWAEPSEVGASRRAEGAGEARPRQAEAEAAEASAAPPTSRAAEAGPREAARRRKVKSLAPAAELRPS
jgi:hypothetical protein